jgi:hypothetical protein
MTAHVARLQGVSKRLSGGMTSGAVGRQGKRVARLFSLLFAPPLAVDDPHNPVDTTATPSTSAVPDAREGDDVDSCTRGGADATINAAAADDDVFEVLYDEEDLSLLPEEIWWVAPPPRTVPQHPGCGQRAPIVSEEGLLTDSDDSDASSASLEELDIEEGTRPIDVDAKWQPVQLHGVLADVRQSENTVKRVEALQQLEQLVRCAPPC